MVDLRAHLITHIMEKIAFFSLSLSQGEPLIIQYGYSQQKKAELR